MRQELRYQLICLFTIGCLFLLAACGGTGTDTSVEEPATEPTAAAEGGETPPTPESAETEEQVEDETATGDDTEATEQQFPDIIGAEITSNADGTFDIAVTVSSPYDTPERYADAWRVLGPDGEELGVRELAHDHQNEQPFTRSLSNVAIPETVEVVTIEGRDQVYGYGGGTLEVEIPRE